MSTFIGASYLSTVKSTYSFKKKLCKLDDGAAT